MTLYERLRQARDGEPVTPIGRRLMLDTPELDAVLALIKAGPGMLEIAEVAMPDTYLETDSRVRAFRAALLRFEEMP